MLGLPLLRPPTSQRIPPIWQILQISSCQAVTSFSSRSRNEFPRAKLRSCFVLFTGLCVDFLNTTQRIEPFFFEYDAKN